MTIGAGHYAVLSGLVFAVGCFGVVARRNGFGILIAVTLMFLGPVIALVGFSEIGLGGQAPPKGSALALVAVLSIAAQALVAVGMLALAWRRQGTVDLDDISELSG